MLYGNVEKTTATGLPSFLIYSYFFWQKDCKEGYHNFSPEYHRDQFFQKIIYKLNQPFLRSGIQSAFTNFSIYDREYLVALFGGKTFPDGDYIINHIEEILEYQKAFMRVLSKVRSENMMTFPVLTFCLLKENGVWADEDFARWCCEHNMKWADSNFFISDDITSLSNCCRLKSNIKDLGYFNSLGGTALEVGSVKVNTINLARIAYQAKDKAEYIKILHEKVVLCLDSLAAVRHIIQRDVDKGLLPQYTNGTMSMESQYNTIGIIGIYEALQAFNLTKEDVFGNISYTTEGEEFAQNILETINEIKNNYVCDYKISVEQVPAERCASILMNKDKQLFPNEIYELPLYGNQWIPLGVQTTLTNKVKISALLDESCGGGSISHISLDAPFDDFNKAWEVLNYVADAGVTYFAFNTKISACKNNHGFYGEICPVCGEKKETTYQRIVGFLTPEKSYSKERKEEFALRDWIELSRFEDLN